MPPPRRPAPPDADVKAILDLAEGADAALRHGDIDAWLEAWAEAGVLVTPFGRLEGRDALRAFGEAFREGAAGKRLTARDARVEVRGGEATVRATLAVERDEAEPVVLGTTTDRLRKGAGGWRFQHRRFEVDAARWLWLEGGAVG